MANLALLTPAFTGHLNPMCVLGRTLARRGHRVSVIAPLDAENKIRNAEMEFIPIGAVELPRGEWQRRTAALGELTGFRASRYVGSWLGDCARGFIRDLPKIVERERFDALVMDQICIGAEAVCEVIRLPMAVACNALALNWEPGVPPPMSHWSYRNTVAAQIRNIAGYVASNLTGLPLARALMAYRRAHRLGQMHLWHMNQMRPSLLQVAQQPAFFDFPRKYLAKHFRYTAPWKESAEISKGDFPWERLDGRPLIYASLGTLQNRLEHLYRIIAAACSQLNAQTVIALGRAGAKAPEDFPGNPIVVGYAPQMALLQRATMVITHGGLNTTLEALAEGLPMVALPITNDQPGVAARIEHLGIGERIRLRELTEERLRSAVQRVLNDPAYRCKAQHLAREMKQLNGPVLAAELIEKAFGFR